MYFFLLKNKHFYLVEEEKYKKWEFEVIVKNTFNGILKIFSMLLYSYRTSIVIRSIPNDAQRRLSIVAYSIMIRKKSNR